MSCSFDLLWMSKELFMCLNGSTFGPAELELANEEYYLNQRKLRILETTVIWQQRWKWNQVELPSRLEN